MKVEDRSESNESDAESSGEVDVGQAEIDRVLRSIVDAMSEAVYAKLADGRYVFANAAAARLLGRPSGDIIGRADRSLLPPSVAAARERIERDVLSSGESASFEETLDMGGTVASVLTTVFPYRDGAGRTAGIIGVQRDVGEAVPRDGAMADQLVQRQQLEESASRLEELTTELEATVDELQARTIEAESARVAAERAEEQARFLDEAGGVLQSSMAYEETLPAVARLAVPRLADWCVVHVVDDGEIRRLEVAHWDPAMLEFAIELERRYPPDPARSGGVHEVVRTGQSVLYAEIPSAMIEASARDEEHRRLLKRLDLRSAIIAPMIATSGRTVGAITLIASESGRRYGPEDVRLAEQLGRRAGLAVYNTQLYEEALSANRAKSDFLATMSHELRTPLNAITGYTDLLQIGVQEREEQLAHLDRIKASAWHLLSVIEQVLSFSRLDASRETFTREPVDIGEVAREAATFMRPAAQQKSLALEIRQPEEPLVIESDRDKVRQILLNLLANAIKFTEAGVISLEVARKDGGASLRVRDTGIGIERQDRERIFEPFFQVEGGITRRAGGTGLGLAVTRELVGLLGGAISVDSAPGAGSTFEVALPARPAD